MSFLFPLYILGAIAIGIPILLHLRRRPPKDHQTFSSLMFLEKTPERLTRRTKVERWLLLMLRCLALILLAIMFSRPFLRSDRVALGEGEGDFVVVLIDSSASMRRGDLWPRALEQAGAAVEITGPSDEVAVARFDDGIDVLQPFSALEKLPGSARADALEKAIPGEGSEESSEATALPSWRSTQLGDALIEAADLIADASADKPVGERRIVLISDFQEGAIRNSLNRYAWPEEVVVEPIVISLEEESGNLALHLVAASEGDEVTPSDTPDGQGIKAPRRKARITNGRDSEEESFSLHWQDHPESRMEGFLPAGASRVIPVPPRSDENLDGILQISGDSYDFDNRAYVARAQPRQVEILYLGSETSSTDVGSPLFYLSRAMHRTSAIDPSVIALDYDALSAQPSALEGRQVVVLRTDRDTPVALATQLAELARTGGLVIGIVSEGTSAKLVQTLTGVPDLGLSEAEVRDYAMLANVDFESPVLAPFAQAKIRDFTKIHTWRHRNLEIPDSSADGFRVLARFDTGAPAWVEVSTESEGGNGRIYLFLSGWEPRESQLALSSKFIPLIYGILGQAGFSAVIEPTRYVGDSLPLPTNENAVTVVGPSGDSFSPRSDSEEFLSTDLPGFYTVSSRDQRDQVQSRVYAINVPPGESQVDPVDPVVALGDFGVQMRAGPSSTSAGEGAAAMSEPLRRRIESEEKEANQKLWKWLLVGALAILLAETWLAGRRRGQTQAGPDVVSAEA